MSITIATCSYVIKQLKKSFVKEICSAQRFFRVHLSKSNEDDIHSNSLATEKMNPIQFSGVLLAREQITRTNVQRVLKDLQLDWIDLFAKVCGAV